MNSDWQDDKTSNLLKRCEIAKSYNETICVWPDAIIELINKATAEKERADKLQAELSEYTEAQWKAFEREQKLMGAIEEILKEDGANVEPEAAYILGLLKNAMESLYQKEETE